MNYNKIYIINNIFQLLYFYFETKYKSENSLFIVVNKNNYLNKSIFYNFFTIGIKNLILLDGDENFKKFPFSIIDSIVYYLKSKKQLLGLSGIDKNTEVIFTVKHNIINKIIIHILISKGFKNFKFFDTSLNSNTSNYINIKDVIYSFIFNNIFFGVKKIYYKKNICDIYILKNQWGFYKNTYQLEILDYLKSENFNYTIDGKVFIFIAQKHSEIGFNDYNYKQFLNQLSEKVTLMGYKFLIKKHPSDNSKVYDNFNLLDIPLQVEFLSFVIKGDIKYGTFFSTSIIYLNKNEVEIIKSNKLLPKYIIQQKELEKIL